MFRRCQQNHFSYEVFVSGFNMLIERTGNSTKRSGTLLNHYL